MRDKPVFYCKKYVLNSPSEKRINPYETVGLEGFDSKTTHIFPSALCICAVCLTALFNSISRGIQLSEFAQTAAIGIFAGECLVLTTWVAWGPNSMKKRFTVTAWTGLFWTAAAWVGFGIANPDSVFLYSHEMLQNFTVAPVFLGIVTFPLVVIQRYNWRFRRGDEMKYSDSSFATWTLATFAVVIMGSYFLDYRFGYFLDDLEIGFLMGIILAIYSTMIVPMLALTFLNERIRIWWLCQVFVVAFSVGFVLSSIIAIPGPGAAPASTLGLATLACFTPLIPLIIAFGIWRTLGFRVR